MAPPDAGHIAELDLLSLTSRRADEGLHTLAEEKNTCLARVRQQGVSEVRRT